MRKAETCEFTELRRVLAEKDGSVSMRHARGNRNDLEEIVLRAAFNARRSYEKMSGVAGLWDAPESFVQMEVARGIAKAGFQVYVDASLKKTGWDLAPTTWPEGSRLGQRFDITVWRKNQRRWNIRAVIEVKQAYDFALVETDATKIKSQRQKIGCRTGYLLVYSVANAKHTVEQRYERWASKLRWQCVGTRTELVEPKLAWGTGLLRLD